MESPVVNQICSTASNQEEQPKLSNNEKPIPKIDIHQSPLITAWNAGRMARGIVNTGNTCFIASTIQCLQHIPAWNNFLLRQHKELCTEEPMKCVVCKLVRLATVSFKEIGSSHVSSQEISRNIDKIGSNMKIGDQQDAHEFLALLFEKIQTNLTAQLGKIDPASEMTTVLGKIFGGYLMNKIVCFGCYQHFHTFEAFFNLSLEITSATVSSVEEALDTFLIPEYTEGYLCDKCHKRQRTVKKYYIDSLPNVLVIHLKRYSYEGIQTAKINKHIEFNERLDVKNYLTDDLRNEASVYLLSGITVHEGDTLNSGHYYSYIADPSNQNQKSPRRWYCMNDGDILEFDWEMVSYEQAYILYYVKATSA